MRLLAAGRRVVALLEAVAAEVAAAAGRIMDRLHEKCAVVGVSTAETSTDAAQIAYQALFALQHRGVEASGIASNGPDGETLRVVRAPGMVRDVFGDDEIQHLQGSTVVGHNRYSTSGNKYSHLQPIVSHDINYAFAHNGNLPEPIKLEKYLQKRRYITSQYNDSELLGNTIASKIHSGRPVEAAIREAMNISIGAYSCVMSYGNQLAAFRDPYGIRPLEIGQIEDGIVFASETCALDTIGAKHMRTVKPGEIVLAENGKIISTNQSVESTEKLDIFELVYFARHDSYLYGQRVNEVRRRLGEELARAHPLELENPVVVPIPDTSTPAAEGYAALLGMPEESAIIKNRYIGRTFMQTSQNSRRQSLQLKHTIISERIVGRDVILVDDSIVRGNTMPRLVGAIRQLGAQSVSVLVASPPVRFPDFYGVDTPLQSELMAANMNVEQMRREISADYLGFLSVSSMVNATYSPADRFTLAAFTGEYPVSIGRHAQNIHPPVSREYME